MRHAGRLQGFSWDSGTERLASTNCSQARIAGLRASYVRSYIPRITARQHMELEVAPHASGFARMHAEYRGSLGFRALFAISA
jgi:hypothetical protein